MNQLKHSLPGDLLSELLRQRPCTQEVCGWINAKATKPVWAKMTPNITDIAFPARTALAAGCEGVAAINTITSVMGINLDTLRPEPSVEGYTTPGGYSSRAVKPIALAKVCRLLHHFHAAYTWQASSLLCGFARQFYRTGMVMGASLGQGDWSVSSDTSDLTPCCMQVMSIAQLIRSEYDNNRDLSGIGGVETGQDAAEFLLLGANSVQVRPRVIAELCILLFSVPLSPLDSAITRPYISHHLQMAAMLAGSKCRQACAASLSEWKCPLAIVKGACRFALASCFMATRWSSSCAEACRCRT